MSEEYRKYLAAKLLVLELVGERATVPALIEKLQAYVERDPECRFFQWAGGTLSDVLLDLTQKGHLNACFSNEGAEQRFGGPGWDQADWMTATLSPTEGVGPYFAYLRNHAIDLLKLPVLV